MPTIRLLLAVLILLASQQAMAGPQSSRKVAVLDFGNPAGLTEQERGLVTDLIRGVAAMLPRTDYLVMTRENILELLPPETDYAKCSGANCEVQFGRMVGAAYVVTGEIVRFGTSLKVSMRLHETATASLVRTEVATAAGVDGLEDPVRAAAGRLLGQLPGAPDLARLVEPARSDSPRAGTVVVEPGVNLKGSRGDAANTFSDETGYLVVRTNPDGAVIRLDGREVGRAPLQLEPPVGHHAVEADLGSLYHPARQEVFLTSSGLRIEMKLDPAFGSLEVISLPGRAEVVVDGIPVGQTPYTNPRMPSGSHEVRVSMPNYLTSTSTVTVQDGKSLRHGVALEPNFGQLTVVTQPPGAAILLDDQDTGKRTPWTFPEVQAGVHLVGLRLQGHAEEVVSVTVRQREAASAATNLKPLLGLLAVSVTDPAGRSRECALRLDDRPAGLTPWKGSLIAMRHTVRVDCDGEVLERPVTVVHNDRVDVSLVTRNPLDALRPSPSPAPVAIPSVTPGRVEPAQRPELPPLQPEPRTTPWYRKWWVWTVVGAAVVVGTGTALGLTVGKRDGDKATGSIQW